MPKVSVLLTVYNGEKYVADAIDSILKQTFSDFEFIIINDGSTDKTESIIKSIKDKRIKFINNQENNGRVAVLNQGLDIAKGEYVALIDADDVALPQRFECQVKFLDENPDVGVVGTAIQMFGTRKNGKKVYYKSDITALDVLFSSPVANPTVMMRRDVIETCQLRYREEYKHAEDYDFWTQAIKYTRIVNIPVVLMKYRQHDANISLVYNKAQSQTAKQIRREFLRFLSDIPYVRNQFYKYARQTRYSNPVFLNSHMMWHHPVRWWKLRKITQEQIKAWNEK